MTTKKFNKTHHTIVNQLKKLSLFTRVYSHAIDKLRSLRITNIVKHTSKANILRILAFGKHRFRQHWDIHILCGLSYIEQQLIAAASFICLPILNQFYIILQIKNRSSDITSKHHSKALKDANDEAISVCWLELVRGSPPNKGGGRGRMYIPHKS